MSSAKFGYTCGCVTSREWPSCSNGSSNIVFLSPLHVLSTAATATESQTPNALPLLPLLRRPEKKSSPQVIAMPNEQQIQLITHHIHGPHASNSLTHSLTPSAAPSKNPRKLPTSTADLHTSRERLHTPPYLTTFPQR
jgi:hypothetical protein